jgi:hypothetical protein
MTEIDASASYSCISSPYRYSSFSGFSACGAVRSSRTSADAAPDIKHMEGLLPKNYGADAVEIPGARDLLHSITKDNIPWAIVTSGTTPLVLGW